MDKDKMKHYGLLIAILVVGILLGLFFGWFTGYTFSLVG